MRVKQRILTCGLLLAVLLQTMASAQPNPSCETLFYLRNNESSVQSFLRHADQISIVGPQVYAVDEEGVVWGAVDDRVLDAARAHGVEVMPLIHNPGFPLEPFRQLLHDPAKRALTIRMMVDLAKEHGFYGWQFDFEHILVSDRDLFTEFYREAADALHAEGFKLSIAVVPTTGQAGPSPYNSHRYAHWSGVFDFRAVAEIGDFISLMTYDQHSLFTPPGPVGGLPWVRERLDYALAQGVPPEKLSMGIPAYSDYWFPTYEESRGRYTTARQIDHATAVGLLERHEAVPVWDEEQGTSMARWTNEGTFEYLTLEDRRAFEAKLDLFRSYGNLRGISVWVLGAEDPGVWEVVEAKCSR